MKHTVTTTTITDDFGAPGDAETITFVYAGDVYEIDLNKRNADTFRRRITALYEPYATAGRKISGDMTGLDDLTKIRTWAANHGFTINSRGRVPRHIIAAYQEDQNRD